MTCHFSKALIKLKDIIFFGITDILTLYHMPSHFTLVFLKDCFFVMLNHCRELLLVTRDQMNLNLIIKLPTD